MTSRCNREITGSTKVDNNVTENVGDIVSISVNADDVYNGIIKSNIVNKTETNTKYNEIDHNNNINKRCYTKFEINLKEMVVNIFTITGTTKIEGYNKTNVEKYIW